MIKCPVAVGVPVDNERWCNESGTYKHRNVVSLKSLVVWYSERVESLTSYREEEDTCTDTCTFPNFRYKETREDKSMQLKKVFNELAEELKVCSYFLSSNSHLNIMLIVCSLFGTF